MASGRLIYLMGASGVGKDSVLGYARARMNGRYQMLIAHRYVTRAPDPAHENYISLSEGEFALRKGKGIFFFDWQAHDLHYAVGIEVSIWLSRGLSVVMNGSRAHFAKEASRMPGILPVMIEARPEMLRQRLEARGREGPDAIAARLARAGSLSILHPALLRIDNSGPLEAAGERLVDVLSRAAP
nr:phosphonate metabolism protein/1,5-bisphosphokinase (PRPP-forming) PhnN [uncultured Dongia sp.]